MKRTKESRKRIGNLILLIAFTSVLLISSIYAWFTTQRDVTITNFNAEVQVAESLEISIDALNWSQVINLSDVSLTADAWDEDANNIPEVLAPVSNDGTVGLTDGNKQEELNMYVGTLEDGKDLSEVHLATGERRKKLLCI